jgi:catechol 2,3-dioxygenase-like lactoylglutathione lyase family enzyme
MGIFTHNCVGTNDVERSGRFYDAALAPLGIRRLGAFLDQGLAYGTRAAELLVLRPLDGTVASPGNGTTLGFKAPDRVSVDAFHAAGLATGGHDEGRAPRLWRLSARSGRQQDLRLLLHSATGGARDMTAAPLSATKTSRSMALARKCRRSPSRQMCVRMVSPG